MKKAYCYLWRGELNDATRYYVEIILEACAATNYETAYTHDTSDLSSADLVVTIVPIDTLRVKISHPRVKVVTWYQGIIPEEAVMQGYGIYRKWYNSLFEYLSLKLSSLNLFVSRAMRDHYRSKYRMSNSVPEFIMPCFNKKLDENCFTPERYTSASFAYAGSLAEWQCFDVTLNFIHAFQKLVPSASLTVITHPGNHGQAWEMIRKLGILNASVKYLPVSEIDSELCRHKYGLLIRKKHVVNKVSTPTKMNTYLSNGLIPIFSDAVEAFKENIILGDSTLMWHTEESIADFAHVVYDHHAGHHSVSEFMSNCKLIFDNYYNREQYVSDLRDSISNLK